MTITIKGLFGEAEAAEAIEVNPTIADTNPINTTDIVRAQAEMAANMGANVAITGSWVWAQFATKPSKDTLSTLKANKWIWCKSKGKWAYRGKPCHSKKTMTWDYITRKYGYETIEQNKELVSL